MQKNVLAIDQGTTGTKALVVNENLEILSQSYHEFPQHFPEPGWVEHDLNEIWESVEKSIQGALKKVDAKSICAIGITNQRETLCFWNKDTGKPLTRAIVWQDRRTNDLCQELIQKGSERFFQEKTGLLLDPYFSGTKAAWAFKNIPEVAIAHKEGRLAMGTIDSYLMARFANGGIHLTEPSNASRTLCFDIYKNAWDQELCQFLGIPLDAWPEVLPTTGEFTRTLGQKNLPDGIPITGVIGDQQSALLGQGCIDAGMAKCTYGTGSFLLMNTGKNPVTSRHRLLTTIAWSLKKGDITYALEGSAFVAGAAVQWLRDGLGIINSSNEIEALAKTVESSDGVVFVPALTGLGAPHWNADTRGVISGLTRGTTKAHLARATLEGIAYQNADLLIAMQKDMGKPIQSLFVDGGASLNNLLMQFQADLLGVELFRPQVQEMTSLGAVFAAGLGAGIWKDLEDIKKHWKKDAQFSPEISPQTRSGLLDKWNKAVKRVLIN